MPKDIHVPARIIGGKIPVRASLGQTVIVKEGPEKYTPAPITPTESEQVIPTKDKQLTDNVTVNPIPSEYIIPTGTEEISVTENGTVSRNVTNKETVTVNTNVPIPPGYIIPTGNMEITENGTYGISEKASVSVDVPIPPQRIVTGTFVGNGTADITISAPFDPDIVIAYSPNKLVDYAVNAAWYFYLGPMVAMLPRRTTSGWSASANVIDLPASNNRPGKTYSDGTLTLLSNTGVYLFANGATYNYILIKLSQ
jgi:hypothetical protein